MYQVKELTALLCVGRCKSMGSLKINPLICTNSFLGSIYCVFTSWVYSELTLGSACSPMTGILFSSEFLRLTDSCRRFAILDDYDIHCLLICVLHPEPTSHLPPRTIPLGHPSAPAPSILYHASNLDWWFISYMILYMFQCHSPKSSHPFPLPQSPKDCSIHLCLFCWLAYRVIVTIFLNSIYMH